MQRKQEHMVAQIHLMSTNVSELQCELGEMIKQLKAEQDASMHTSSQSLVVPDAASRGSEVRKISRNPELGAIMNHRSVDVPMLMVSRD